jgi:hypothetical protein
MSVLQQVRALAKTRHGNDLQRAFKRFDLNQDRQLTAKELLAALLSLGVTTGTRASGACSSLARSTLRIPKQYATQTLRGAATLACVPL